MSPVSIIVPSFNRPSRLRNCLDALAALEGGPFDTIVVDDGSDLPLAPVAEPFGSWVRVVRQDNRGPAAARNAGAAVSDAAILAFTDDDCRPRPAWIRLLVRAIDAGGDCALVGGRVVNGLEGNVFAAASQSLCDFLYAYFGAASGGSSFFTSNNIAMRRTDFLALGGFDESFPLAAAEDRDFCLRWRANGGKMVYEESAVVEHYHGLNAAAFWRQHRNYGRGARHLHRLMDRRGDTRPRFEHLQFYARLLLHPLTDRHPRALRRAALMALSQVAMISGYLSEAQRPSAGTSRSSN